MWRTRRTDSMHRKALVKTVEQWSRLPGKFKLIVTSRNEKDIERLFSKTPHHTIEIMAGRTVDVQSSEDIRVFLEDRLREVALDYPTALPSDWPGAKIVDRLVHRAAGLFIWAETVAKFIVDGHTQRRMNQVLEDGDTGEEEVDEMGTLYKQILNDGFRKSTDKDIVEFCSVVGTIILAKTPLSLSSLSDLLTIDACAAERIYNVLRPVLHSEGALQFHHQSFVDYLVDQTKCPQGFLIDPMREHRALAVACLQTMKNHLRFNICGLESSHHRNSDIPDLSSRANKHIPSHLLYSSCWWASHLEEFEFELEILWDVEYFMRKQFLWWLEVLSITKQINLASRMLSSLIDWVPSNGQDEVATPARDMWKFVAVFASVISQSAAHIYVSALPFSPPSSAVSKEYMEEYSHTLRIQRGGLSNWPSIQNVLTGHSGPVSSVAYSPNGKRVISGSRDNTIRVWDAETDDVVAGPFKGHSRYVSSVAYSPDGKHVVSGAWDNTIRVWDAETGDVVAGSFEGHSGFVLSVAYSLDGKRVVSGSGDEAIRVWDAETGGVVAGPFQGHNGPTFSIACSPDGKRVVFGSEDKTARSMDALLAN